MKKICTVCKIEKTLSCFSKHSQCLYGVSPRCRICISKEGKLWRQTEAYKKWKDGYRETYNANHKRFSQTEKGKKLQKKKEKKARRLYPEKATAREKLRYAVRSGKINREPCVVCGKKNGEGHHEDYSKPLEVVWLCGIHHRERHKNMKVQP